MKVLINQTLALRQKSGMGHYIADLIRCLPAQAGPDKVLLYPGAFAKIGLAGWKKLTAMLGKLGGLLARGPTTAASAAGRDWLKSWPRQMQSWHFRACWSHAKFDLYHEPNYIPLPCSRPTIVTVADLSSLLHPEWHPAERARHFAQNFEHGLERSAHIITISEFSRQEILRHLSVSPSKVTCTYMGIRPGLGPLPRHAMAQTLERLGLPDDYLLYVGTARI